MFAIADIIAQETQDGRLIVRFLISTMHGELPDSQPCHRLDAARLLVKLGFEPAQSLIDRAAPRRSPQPHLRSQPQPEPEPDSSSHRIRSALAEIVLDETDHGRAAVRFLVDAMQGQLPDFKPCHRLSAARELLRLGFNHDAEDSGHDPRDAAQADPEPDPEEIEAQRQLAEDIEFSLHSPVYYQTYPYPCVCEDRLHDCEGNALDDGQLEQAARKGPGMQFFIGERNRMDDFLARYADYLTRRNSENPRNPIDINRILWTDQRWQHLNPARGP